MSSLRAGAVELLSSIQLTKNTDPRKCMLNFIVLIMLRTHQGTIELLVTGAVTALREARSSAYFWFLLLVCGLTRCQESDH